MAIIEKFNNHVITSYGRYDVVLKNGHGEKVKDEEGKEFIDFGSGIGTNSLGFCDDEWVSLVTKQAQNLQHTSNYYYTAIQAEFAQKLSENSGYAKAFFGNSGAEANECAIKLARKYSFDKYGKGRHTILTLTGSFHGRTLATLSATGQDEFHNYFFPFVEGFVHVKANDIEDLKQKLDDTVCAVMFEYIQGESGVNPLTQEFVDAIFDLAKDKDILTIADEVQTGVGRTGKFLAGMHYGKKADITTLAKGIAGGIPMGACLVDEKCAHVLTRGTHGSTFGGNPIACAGGIAVMNRTSDTAFLEEVEKKGAYIRETLLPLEEVVEIRGLGLMVGITLKTKSAADVNKALLENGVLALTAKDKLRFLPPLTISFESLQKGLDIVKTVLEA